MPTIEKVAGLKLAIGMDLGDRSNWYCVLDQSGEVLLEEKVLQRLWDKRRCAANIVFVRRRGLRPLARGPKSSLLSVARAAPHREAGLVVALQPPLRIALRTSASRARSCGKVSR
jgi:hypothetical protein